MTYKKQITQLAKELRKHFKNDEEFTKHIGISRKTWHNRQIAHKWKEVEERTIKLLKIEIDLGFFDIK